MSMALFNTTFGVFNALKFATKVVFLRALAPLGVYVAKQGGVAALAGRAKEKAASVSACGASPSRRKDYS
jgi:hypothetical protein